MRRALAAVPLIVAPTAAWAHAGHDHHQAPGWTLEPSVTVPLAVTILVFAVGFVRLRRRSRRGRGGVERSAALFSAGWLVLVGALASPLHEAGERSFAAHMIEHELIMLVATLLLATSSAGPILIWGLPAAVRRRFSRLAHRRAVESSWAALTSPWIATALQALALWLWHAPALFDRALQNEGWHVVQHLSFLLTSLLFWWAIARADRQGRIGVAAFCLLITACVGAALGALMALSSSPWYASYAKLGMTPFGLTPQQDQQMAGLIMWIPGGVVHMGAALAIIYRWLQPQEVRHVVAAR